MMGRSSGDDEIGAAFAELPMSPSGFSTTILEFVRTAADDRAQMPELDVAATDLGVSRVDFGTGRTDAVSRVARRHAEQAREELAEFFAAERGYFTVAVDLSRARPFQRAVLEAASQIPLGQVRSYRWVAAGAGNRDAVRAVGSALGKNPVPLIVPCHRVVRTDGSLGGYAGGLPLKRRLLLLEREIPGLVGIAATKRVCQVGCPEQRNTTELDRVVFSSVASARASGYAPCPKCAPKDPAGEGAVRPVS